jgi:hypothetical protein
VVPVLLSVMVFDRERASSLEPEDAIEFVPAAEPGAPLEPATPASELMVPLASALLPASILDSEASAPGEASGEALPSAPEAASVLLASEPSVDDPSVALLGEAPGEASGEAPGEAAGEAAGLPALSEDCVVVVVVVSPPVPLPDMAYQAAPPANASAATTAMMRLAPPFSPSSRGISLSYFSGPVL